MAAVLKHPAERTRFVKFAIVGAIGAVLDFAVMNLLVAFAHAPFVVAGTISFICAVSSNFTWNRLWTYPESRSKPLLGQLGQFTLVNAAGLLIRVPILKFLEPTLDTLLTDLPITMQYHQFLSHNATLAFAIGVVMLWNYFVNRYWTYNDVEIAGS